MNVDIGNEQRLAAIGVQAGGIAHDFNNILTAIFGYGERALSHAARGSRLRRDLEGILAASERARSLVQQVLALGTSSSSERATVDVETEIRDALDLLLARMPTHVTIDTSFESGGSAVYARPNDVHRLFMNLAINALHAMPAGGTLGVSVTTESFTAAQVMPVGAVTSGRYVVLRVSDSGSGIAPTMVGCIFDSFFTTRAADGGTGLGLSVVREIATDSGGAIDVESRLGAGSRFTVYLPSATPGVKAHTTQ